MKFIPKKELINNIAYQVYINRLETCGRDIQMEEKTIRSNSQIYVPVIKETLIYLKEFGHDIDGEWYEPKQKNTA